MHFLKGQDHGLWYSNVKKGIKLGGFFKNNSSFVLSNQNRLKMRLFFKSKSNCKKIPSIEYELFECFMFHPGDFTLSFKKHSCNKRIIILFKKGMA